MSQVYERRHSFVKNTLKKWGNNLEVNVFICTFARLLVKTGQ